MICETNLVHQLWFINQPLDHVSGTIIPIFRSARPYITAYTALNVLAGVLGSLGAGPPPGFPRLQPAH